MVHGKSTNGRLYKHNLISVYIAISIFLELCMEWDFCELFYIKHVVHNYHMILNAASHMPLMALYLKYNFLYKLQLFSHYVHIAI